MAKGPTKRKSSSIIHANDIMTLQTSHLNKPVSTNSITSISFEYDKAETLISGPIEDLI